MVLLRLIAVLALAASVLAEERRAAASEALVGKPAPAIDLDLSSGKRFVLESQKGKIVILAFWATWCEPCRDEIPRLIALQREYQSKDVVVVGISAEEPAVVMAFLAAERLEFPTAIDTNKQVSNAYGIDLVPRTFLIDRSGIVTKMLRGAPSEASLRKAVSATLH